MMTACLIENTVKVSVHGIAELVESTFAEYDSDKDGLISFPEFQAMVDANPGFMEPVTLNVPELIAVAHEGGVSTRTLKPAASSA
jgi:hypothetical protein